jgi:2'-hydroxyisoflavone reductase
MRILILGGTAWLGHTVAAAAVEDGHSVVCLARGSSGAIPTGADFVRVDRSQAGAYDAVREDSWEVILDLSREPSHVVGALRALADRAGHWVFVSTGNVYADLAAVDADEFAALRMPLPSDEPASPETYGEGKVACEQAVLHHCGPDHALIARAGLIAGPDEPFDRTGYWPWRFARPARPDNAVLVPDVPHLLTSMIDVRDLARFLLKAGMSKVSGAYDTVGEPMSLEDHLTVARSVAHHSGPLVRATPEWLTAHAVQPWMGQRSLPLWLPPEVAGMTARRGSRARAAGLETRPLEDTLADTLAWELSREQPRPRKAGLSDDDERELLSLLAP